MTVFRRGDLFWGVIQVYDRITGFMHSELAWSGDGEHWSQVATHSAFLKRGSEGAWDYGMVSVAEAPIIVDDEMRFYYGGAENNHHSETRASAIGLATVERDRLAGLRPSGDAPGYVLTRPMLIPTTAELFVNAVVPKKGGSIRAELRDDNNHVLKGFSLEECTPVTASGLAQSITWKGQSIGAMSSQELRIRFEVSQAELFTFDIVRQKELATTCRAGCLSKPIKKGQTETQGGLGV